MRPIISRFTAFAAVLLLSGIATAQPVKLFGLRVAPSAKFGGKSVQTAEKGASSYIIETSAIDAITSKSKVSIGDVPLRASNGRTAYVELELEEFFVYTPQTKFLIEVNGVEAEGPKPSIKTYRGKIKGQSNSHVVLSISHSHISGRIHSRDGAFSIGHQVIGGSTTVAEKSGKEELAAPSVPTRVAVIANEAAQQVATPSFDCGVTEHESFEPNGIIKFDEAMLSRAALRSDRASGKGARAQAATLAAAVAIEGDYELVQRFGGSTQATTDWLVARMASISSVYEKEAGVAITMPYLKLYPEANDPYPTVGGTDPLLDAFLKYWNSNRGNVDRTVAHLVSGQDMGNPYASMGLAYVNVLCSKTHGYGVTRVLASESWPSIDESVLAHEFGHNFGSRHTHNCDQWITAIDSCVAAEGSCYGGAKPIRGTIMSYCNQTDFTFGPRVQAFLQAQVEATECWKPFAGGSGVSILSAQVVMGQIEPGDSRDSVLKKFFRNNSSETTTVTANFVGSSDFTIESPEFPLELAPNQQVDMRVSYQAAERGVDNGVLYLDYSDKNSATVSFSGIAVPKGPAGSPLSFNAKKYEYWEKKVGSYNDSLIMIMNMTGDTLDITNIRWVTKVGGANAFSIIGSQTMAVPSVGMTWIKVRFNPQQPQVKESIRILPYGASAQDTLTFRGTGSFNPKSVGEADELNIAFNASPNPFVKTQDLSMTIPEDMLGSELELIAYDVLGHEVERIYTGAISSSDMKLEWTPKDLSSGTYIIVARVDDRVLSRRVVYQP